jgi:hypothetical protein
MTLTNCVILPGLGQAAIDLPLFLAMGEQVRHCARCGREITACMGFALGRDISSGRRPVREHCGFCVEWLDSSGSSQEYLEGILDDTSSEDRV